MTTPIIANDEVFRPPLDKRRRDVAADLDLMGSRARTRRRETEERRARTALRDQIARLESELSGMVCSEFPLEPIAAAAPPKRRTLPGAALCSIGDLERQRDELAERVAATRTELEERGQCREQARMLREEMMLDPAAHRWVRVTNENIGEPGCKQWHVRPRFGVLGMLMNWWRVRISSGCPLARGRGPSP
jgi:hypothetical protein